MTLHLADDLDVGRGDLICRPTEQPAASQDLEAMVCWMSDRPLVPNGRYALKHTTKWTRAIATEITYRLDINTGHCDESARELRANDLARIKLRTMAPIFSDPYTRNRLTGSFALVDESTHATVAAGMLL
ncbi:MAG: hypothetical protein WKG01_29565 [Kofleriaceae bacterium]